MISISKPNCWPSTFSKIYAAATPAIVYLNTNYCLTGAISKFKPRMRQQATT